VLAPRAAALAACAVLLFPPVLAAMAVVGDDAQLAGFAIATCAAASSARRGVRLGGLALALVACGMRPGACAAVLPALALAGAWLPALRGGRRYALAVATWVAVAVAAHVLGGGLVDSRTQRADLDLARLDTIGVLRFAEPLSDAELRDVFAGAPLASPEHIQARATDAYTHPNQAVGERRMFDDALAPPARQALRRARLDLVHAHFGAYVRHRWHQLRRVLGLAVDAAWRPDVTTFAESPQQRFAIHYAARHSGVQAALVAAMHAIAPSPLFRPVVYVLLALVLLPLAAYRRARDAAALLAGALAYTAALFAFATVPTYQLSTYPIAATVLAIALLIARGATGRAGPAASRLAAAVTTASGTAAPPAGSPAPASAA